MKLHRSSPPASAFRNARGSVVLRLLPVIAFSACLAVGWWLGAARHGEAPSSAAVAGAAKAPAPLAPQSAAAQLASLLQQPQGLARRWALIAFRETTRPPAEIRALLESGAASANDKRRLLQQWMTHDPAALWRWMESQGPDEETRRMISVHSLFSEWFRRDPEAALACCRGADWRDKHAMAGGILDQLFSDEAAVREKALAHFDEMTAMTGYPRHLAFLSRQEALDKVLALPLSSGRTELLKSVLQSHFFKVPEAVLQAAGRLSEPERAAVMKTLVGQTVLELSRDEVLPYITPGLTGAERDQVLRRHLDWARHWLETEAAQEAKQELAPTFLRALAAQDVPAALAWAQEHISGIALARSVGEIAAKQAAADPAQALEWIDSLPPGGVKAGASLKLAQAWVKTDAPAAMSWLLAQPDLKRDESTFGRVTAEWSFNDPEGFKTFVAGRVAVDPADQFFLSALDHMAQQDNAGAVDWALSLPPGEARDQAIRRSFLAWARRDAAQAAHYLAASPALTATPDYVAFASLNYFAQQPEAATEWAASLPDRLRGPAVNTIRHQIEQNSRLSDTEKAGLRAALGTPP